MKITPVERNIDVDIDEDEEHLIDQEPEIINESTSELTDIDVQDVKTPSGRNAIQFISPISKKLVIILHPTTLDLIEIERTTRRKHPDAGTFEQSIVFLSKLIVGYDDKRGEGILSFQKVAKLEPNEILAINMIASEFFRLGKI